MSKIKIFVTYFTNDKPYIGSEIYQPIMAGNVGRQLPNGFIGDDTGDNISQLNQCYGELTSHYWIFKNYIPTAKEEYIGLCHYRRFLDFRKENEEIINLGREFPESPLNLTFYKYFIDYLFNKYSESLILSIIDGYDLITTYKWNFVNRTNRVQFDFYHIASEMDIALKTIKKVFPEYSKYAEEFFNDKEGYYCFCSVMSKSLLQDYFTWQFTLLDELSKVSKWEQYTEIRDLGMPEFERYRQYKEVRMPAFIMERLYNVWIRYQIDNNKIKVLELPCNILISPDEVTPEKRTKFIKQLASENKTIDPYYMDKISAQHPALNSLINLLVKKKKYYKLLGDPKSFFYDSHSLMLRFIGVFYK